MRDLDAKGLDNYRQLKQVAKHIKEIISSIIYQNP